jgi:hypothetical protein
VVEIGDDALDLGAANAWPRERLDRIELPCIDSPAVAALLKEDGAGHCCLRRAKRLHSGQPIGNGGFVGCGSQ